MKPFGASNCILSERGKIMLFFTTGTEKEKTYTISAETAFNTYSDMVWRLALTKTGSKYTADDLLQEVFLKFIRKNPKFYDEKHCKAWLIRVTINISNNILNSAWNKRREELDENFFTEIQETSEVYSEVLKLPEKYRTAIHLHYYEGYSVEEISKICKTKQATVKTWLHRGRKQLEELLKGEISDV